MAIVNAKRNLGKDIKPFWKQVSEQRQLIVLSLPFAIIVLIFNYLPLWGWILAFKNYTPAGGVWGSEWVGLANFKELFSDRDFYEALRNTLAISSLKLIFGFVSTICLAILLNEVRNVLFKRTVQTISYLPYFVSWVVAANIVYMALSPTDGIVNEILLKLNIVDKPIPFLGEEGYFWWVVALSHVWKEVGWGAIIYLAAMTSIDPDLYEAAAIDGAGRFRRIIHITIPGIAPTIKILLILNIGWILNAGFDQVYLLMNPAVSNSATTLEIYVYNYAMKYFRYSYGTAIGIFNSVVSFILIMLANYISKKVSEEGIF
ncbi:ABC transporter permease [Mahella australiensis]|uniref:Carbohydrate ABC transporter membrane protein 1, CUT1 family n=1 Tax=Mahella australiensis (strain DSM 15567 / CIP 107919 / 50-1 BON) TaxID=697281 RepID=F4A2J9_MAHA5|nr:ABC transporter permease subunit [Mahella australiensis]AEE97265.1 carbohydrate ABC transporter membrane protein 1, CUT1 family [Mahella australiensis 50-1 BON]